MHHVDACHAWRWKQEGESDEAYGLRVANTLEQKIPELGADSVAAVVVAPVQGSNRMARRQS